MTKRDEIEWKMVEGVKMTAEEHEAAIVHLLAMIDELEAASGRGNVITREETTMNRKQAKAAADDVLTFSDPEDAKLHIPNIAGVIASAKLEANGWYACIVAGRKIYMEIAR